MKKHLLITLGLILSLSCFSQTSIWKISKNGSSLYLGGTIHILRSNDYPLPIEFDSAYSKASKIIFETDLDKINDPEITQSFFKKGLLTGDTTLKELLNDTVYKKLEQEFSKLSIPLDGILKFKPSIAMLTMTVVKMQQLGISSEGIDKYYHTKAKQDNIELGFLETVDQQIDKIINIGEGNEDEFVNYSLQDLDKIENGFQKLISDWRNGSSEEMMQQITAMQQDFPDIYNSLLVERNSCWLPQIENYLKDEKTEFILVGSLHLHGSDGLLKKLEEKGYKIEQYKEELQLLNFNYNGVSLSYTDNWTIKNEVIQEDIAYYAFCEKKDLNSSEALTISWLNIEVSPNKMITNTIETLKKDSTMKDMIIGNITDNKFKKYNSQILDFEGTVMGEKFYGRATSFNFNGKSILIIKQSDLKTKLDSEFNIMEESFEIK